MGQVLESGSGWQGPGTVVGSMVGTRGQRLIEASSPGVEENEQGLLEG